MKKALASILSAFMALATCVSMSACSNSVSYEVKAPAVQQSESVVSVSSDTEVGLKAGFPLPHYDGQMESVYDYDDDFYYFNNNRTTGADPGVMYTSKEDLENTYTKLIAKESQFLLGKTEEEILSVVSEKYGSWDEWEEKYLDKFYLVVTSDFGHGVSSETKQKYPEAIASTYELRTSDDLSNWSLSGELDGRAVLIKNDNWTGGNNAWAPEINKDPFSGLYMISGSMQSKAGNSNTDYNPDTTGGTDTDKWDLLTPFLAISPTPTGPYRIVSSDEYYAYIAQFNPDGSVYTVEINGEQWAVYRKDLKWEEGNEFGGYVPLSKVENGVILNQNGIQIGNNNSMLSIGFYHEKIKQAIPHWTAKNKGIFPAIDTHMFVESTGQVYLYFNSHSSSATRGNQIWCLPMKDLATPDWDRFTPVTSSRYSTLYYDGETQGDFSDFPVYRDYYASKKGISQKLHPAIFGVPGYYMGESVEGNVNEATHVVEKDGYFYLTYAPFGYKNKYYSVYFAVSESPFGPFIKVPEFCPSLGVDPSEAQDFIAGTGHHAFVTVGDEMWVIYHYFYNPSNNNDANGNFLGRCIAGDRINWYDYDNVKYSDLKEKQIQKDVESGLDKAWIEECYETGNHRNFAKKTTSDVIKIPYGNGPTYSLQPKTEVFTGYDNVAKTATVTMLEGDSATSKYANDGMISYQLWSNKYEVVGNANTRQLKLKLSWDTPQTIRNIMIYNSRDYLYAFNSVESIVFKLAQKPTWYPEGKEYNGYAYINDLKPDASGWDDDNFAMRKGGSAMATFNEITVTEIIITIDARDKAGEIILSSSNRYIVKLSEIYIMGNPQIKELRR